MRETAAQGFAWIRATAPALILVLPLLAGSAGAGPMTLQWQDSPGDGAARGDLVTVRLQFDSSGHWTAFWYADPAHPFNGSVRFNLNIFNTALGNPALAHAPHLSLDGFHDFLGGTASSFSYSGQSAFLGGWKIGDVVTTANDSSFISGLVDQQAPFGRDKLFAQAAVTGSLPEPRAWALTLLALATALLGSRRRYAKLAPRRPQPK
ncbi:hypothetical protein RQP53_14235 [Paucibacter sp. APW11]|uniref:PEP-CTERM protein-sorting domain-containing protein n=1 Tax=Roseateles aquae TaxID=3077235 RepID=A0ABU3PCY6_9BURK|nr:hypothetical protein [Paucibacter sp. APW11]MDT9000430.1 hypothetical protein [Paucibacter sp. APW11]